MKQIAVVGCIGAGKSTLARALGQQLALPVVHLDRLWWEDGRYVIRGRRTVEQPTLPRGEYHDRQRRLVGADEWVMDGGVDGLAPRLGRADLAVFLDLPILLCAWRVIRRTGQPCVDYPPDVEESRRWMLVLLKWVLWTYPRERRHRIEELLTAYTTSVHVVRLRSRRDVETYLRSVRNR